MDTNQHTPAATLSSATIAWALKTRPVSASIHHVGTDRVKLTLLKAA